MYNYFDAPIITANDLIAEVSMQVIDCDNKNISHIWLTSPMKIFTVIYVEVLAKC